MRTYVYVLAALVLVIGAGAVFAYYQAAQADCCNAASPCCTQGCCYAGSDCCYPGSPCCGEGCCYPGSDCCFPGSPCCDTSACCVTTPRRSAPCCTGD